jgi:DNA topoisomerase-1
MTTITKSKKVQLTTTLVIVESPAKCKKIEEYLGPGYKVIASFGHLRELGSLKNVDIENHFTPNYQIINDERKRKHIEFMRKDIYSADDVILATDDDREGEAIAWHICALFDLPVDKTKRIVFHEITERAIQAAILNPRNIDLNLVYSQQARQILDLLVGFTISPLLWKYIAKNAENSLSAGRCQTPALKLVYENQLEINNSPGKKVYNTVGYFTNKCIPFDLNARYDSEDKMLTFLEETVNFDHIYNCSAPKKVFKAQPEPLTTSRIQQLASNELHISPKETMRLCQILYEEGHITYMRTDSKKYSKDFIDTAKEYIVKEYMDPRYLNPQIDALANTKDNAETQEETKKPKKTKKTKGESKKEEKEKDLSQEAHEAIRPTKISVKSVEDKMGPREKKLYKLIWETTLESCMSQAEFFQINASISAPFEAKYTHSSEIVDFPGWKIVKNKYSDAEKSKVYTYLQSIKQDAAYHYKKVSCTMSLTDTKSHYTEARLVQLLEERGIGRPSTFSTLIDKIQERGYVKKEDVSGRSLQCNDFELEEETITEKKTTREVGNEKNKLVIQQLGIIVMEFLDKHFNSLFNYDYTRLMEDDLDKISKGEKDWTLLCDSCLNTMEESCKELKDEKKHEIRIDENHSYIIGKYGPVIKCVEGKDAQGKDKVVFKPIKKDINLEVLERGGYKLEDLLDIDAKKKGDPPIGKFHGEDLFIKKGKYGLYANWGESNKSLSCFGNRPAANITYDEVLAILMKDELDGNLGKKGPNIIREITSNISIRNSAHGDYLFFKTPKMKKPVFYKLGGFKGDYKNCNIEILKSWIIDEHKIRI